MKTFLILGSLFSISAFGADFSGNWNGKGVSIELGVPYNCEMQWNLQQTAESITIAGSGYLCQPSNGPGEGYAGGFNEVKLSIVNGDLLFEDQKIGTISGNKVNFAFPEQNQEIELEVTELGLLFKQIDTCANGKLCAVMNGILAK